MKKSSRKGGFAANPSCSGLTLIEIITVLAIGTILITLAANSGFNLLTSYSLSTGVRDVSNHLVKARSEAIAKHTLTRLVIAKAWPQQEGDFRNYSIWRWNAQRSEFEQSTPWKALPIGIVFEPRLPDYIAASGYALNDATSVHGEDGMNKPDSAIEVSTLEGNPVEVQFVEFLPNGAARIPEGVLKKVIFVLVEGDIEETLAGPIVRYRYPKEAGPKNWAQVNVDTLTGRISLYRP